MSTLNDFLISNNISIRVGYITVAPGKNSLEEILKAVDQHNLKAGINGLDSRLNPNVLDRDRVTDFLNALPEIPANQTPLLKGKSIYLNGITPPLSKGSPFSAESFTKGISLQIDPEDGQLLKPTISGQIDEKFTRETIALAKTEIEKNNALLAGLTKMETAIRGGAAGDLSQNLIAQSEAGSRRMNATATWYNNLQALNYLAPGDPSNQGELMKVEKLLNEYLVAPSTGMPGGMP